MWYEVIVTRNRGILQFEFQTYDQVLTLFNLLRDTKQYGTYFVCVTSEKEILIDRTVMQ